MDFLWWIIVGLVAGGIASLIVPGRTPFGMVGALVIGIVGGLLGGWLLNTVLDLGVGGGIVGAILVAVIGAVIILYALREVDTRRTA